MRLIPLLVEAQERHGYLSEETLRELARTHTIPLHKFQQIISFYPHFRTTPPLRIELAVCRDASCRLAGGKDLAERLAPMLGSDVEVHAVSCLGRCDRAPAACVNGMPIQVERCESACEAVARPETIPDPRCGSAPRWECDPYGDEAERYSTVTAARTRSTYTADAVTTLKAAGLRGMGGAGFPTGTKWELVAKESRGPKYVVCNADESEPGTFKDREILADLPHLVIEGMALAGLAVGAEKGILYLRHEYGPEQRRFEAELRRAYDRGVLGSADPHGRRFDIEVFVSPGGYILGEETALLEALEDKRGEPRNKPPFPGTHGLHGLPTLINNVETLCMSAVILNRGADWWNVQGKPGFSGLKFISVSGHVARPGVYLIPSGTTVRELIDRCGGMADGRSLLAFAPGGASSNFLPASAVDVALDFNALQKAGSMLGSGALMVVAEGTDLADLALNITQFFRNESCGKCVPCRVGSQKAVEMMEGCATGRFPRTVLQLLPELNDTMYQTSICGLGQIALSPALSIFRQWPELTR